MLRCPASALGCRYAALKYLSKHRIICQILWASVPFGDRQNEEGSPRGEQTMVKEQEQKDLVLLVGVDVGSTTPSTAAGPSSSCSPLGACPIM